LMPFLACLHRHRVREPAIAWVNTLSGERAYDLGRTPRTSASRSAVGGKGSSLLHEAVTTGTQSFGDCNLDRRPAFEPVGRADRNAWGSSAGAATGGDAGPGTNDHNPREANLRMYWATACESVERGRKQAPGHACRRFIRLQLASEETASPFEHRHGCDPSRCTVRAWETRHPARRRCERRRAAQRRVARAAE
jgi:hypothetical protein